MDVSLHNAAHHLKEINVPEQHKMSLIIGMAAGIFGVIATLLTLPFWAGNVTSDVAAHTRRLDIQRADIDLLQKNVSCLQVDVKGIQVDTVWLRSGMERLINLQTKHYRISEDNNQMAKRNNALLKKEVNEAKGGGPMGQQN
jgi:hypothetical protein